MEYQGKKMETFRFRDMGVTFRGREGRDASGEESVACQGYCLVACQS